MEKKIGVTPEKDVDTEARTRFAKIFFRFFLVFTIPWMLMAGPVKGFFISIGFTFAMSFLAMKTLDRAGDAWAYMLGHRKPIIDLREQMQGSLKAVRVSKMNKAYKTALDQVNHILDKDPEFHEAMFVKAQILEEGFGNYPGARKYLRKVMAETPKESSLNTWARSLYRTVSEKEENSPDTP